MIIILIILFLNIVWAVINWKIEFDYIRVIWLGKRKNIKMIEYPGSIIRLVLDIVITGSATSILGLAGFYGAAGALFMSNLLSVFFFNPGCRKRKETITDNKGN